MQSGSGGGSVGRLLLTPEVRGSNPVVSKLLYRTFNCLPTANCIEKTKIKNKTPGMAHLKKQVHAIHLRQKRLRSK